MKNLLSVVMVTFCGLTFIEMSWAGDTSKHQKLLEKQEEISVKQNELKHPLSEASTKRIQASNKSMQAVSRVSKIIGITVKNPKGDLLGNIAELMIEPASGQTVYAVVAVGGVLSMGDKFFAIPWQALILSSNKAYYVLDMDKKTLETSPGFDKNHWPDSSDQADLQREGLNQFYPTKLRKVQKTMK